MKKILFNIYIIFGITSLAFAQDMYDITYVSGFEMADYHSDSDCKPTRGSGDSSDDTHLVLKGENIYYKVNDSSSAKSCEKDWVCSRVPATVDDNTKSTPYCFFGDVHGPDEWDDGSYPPSSIATCSNVSGFEKFTKGDLSVFVATDQKVLMGKHQGQTFSPKTLVNKKNSIKCVGFVCKNGTYACNNGTCVANPNDICPEDIPPAKTINGLPKIPTPPNPPASHESKAKEWKSKLK